MNTFQTIAPVRLDGVYTVDASLISPAPIGAIGRQVVSDWKGVAQVPEGLWLVRWRYVMDRIDQGYVARVCFVEEVMASSQNPNLTPYQYGIHFFDVDQRGMTVVQGPATVYMSQSPATDPTIPIPLDAQFEIVGVRMDARSPHQGEAFGGFGQDLPSPEGAFLPGISSGPLTSERFTCRLTSLTSGAGVYLGVQAPAGVTIGNNWQPRVVQIASADWSGGTAGAGNHARVETNLGMRRGYVGHQSRWPVIYNGWPSNGGTGLRLFNEGPDTLTSIVVVLERSDTPPSLLGETLYAGSSRAEVLAVGTWSNVMPANADRRYLRVVNEDTVDSLRIRFSTQDAVGWLVAPGAVVERREPLPASTVEATAVAGTPTVRMWEEVG